MEEWKKRHPHTFIGMMAQELLRSVEENDLTQTKDLGNQIQTLNSVAEQNHKKLENDFANLKVELDENKAKIAKMEAEKKDHDQKIEASDVALQKAIDDSANQHKEKDIRIQNLEAQIKDLEAETSENDVSKLREKCTNLQQSFTNFLAKQNTADQLTEKLETQIQEFTSKLKDSEDEVESLQKDLVDCNAKISGLVTDMNNYIQKSDVLANHLNDQVKEKNIKIEDLEAQIEELKAKLKPQISEGKSSEKRDLENKMEALKARLKRKEKELKDKEKELTESESRFFGSKVRINVLENETKNLSIEIETLKKQTQSYEQLKAKYLKVETEFKDFKAISKIHAKHAKVSTDSLEAEKQINNDLKSKINSLQIELKALKSREDDAKAREDFKDLHLDALKEKNNKLKAEREKRMDSKVKEVKDSNDPLEQINNDLKARILELEKNYYMMENQLLGNEKDNRNRFQALLKIKHPNHASKAQDNSKDEEEDLYNDDSEIEIETKSFEMNAAFMELSVDEASKIASFHDELDPLATTQITDDVQDAKNETSFFSEENQTVIENVNEEAK